MGKPISVGDLVMVVKPTLCCGKAGVIGKVFKVTEVFISRFNQCNICRRIFKDVKVAVDSSRFALPSGGGGSFQLSRLIRIDPPATGDSLPTRKDIKEPA